jgi:hypothetical protein
VFVAFTIVCCIVPIIPSVQKLKLTCGKFIFNLSIICSCSSFSHLLVKKTVLGQVLPNWVLHRVWSSASFFKFQYLFFFLRSCSCCLHHLLHLLIFSEGFFFYKMYIVSVQTMHIDAPTCNRILETLPLCNPPSCLGNMEEPSSWQPQCVCHILNIQSVKLCATFITIAA